MTTGELAFTLVDDPFTTVTGRIIDNQGNPVSGITVGVAGQPLTTDVDWIRLRPETDQPRGLSLLFSPDSGEFSVLIAAQSLLPNHYQIRHLGGIAVASPKASKFH